MGWIKPDLTVAEAALTAGAVITGVAAVATVVVQGNNTQPASATANAPTVQADVQKK